MSGTPESPTTGPVPQERTKGAPEDSTGPVPQGSPPAEGPPADAGPSSTGPSPTGHPSSPHPRADAENLSEAAPEPGVGEAVEAEPVPADAPAEERHDYLDDLRRLQAEFENFKKRMVRQQTDLLERAAEQLVLKLLPVLDTVDLARSHGASEDVEQVAGSLVTVLEKEGLERIDPVGEAFDPTQHEAVQHEPGDGDPVVSGLMRAGYRWKGRVVRPAMVMVKG